MPLLVPGSAVPSEQLGPHLRWHHFEQMAQKPEAGDVGRGMDAVGVGALPILKTFHQLVLA